MSAGVSLRQRLRAATSEAHERLHAHEGFAAAARGRISLDDYQLLLARLLGFHRPFEAGIAAAAGTVATDIGVSERARARLIESDLLSLGLTAVDMRRLPECETFPRPSCEAELLGALYVVEGSTLGGAQIAAALEPVARDARRFYLGHRARNGQMWRAFVMALERLSGETAQEAAAISAACRTFAAFEDWMSGWREGARPELAAPAEESRLR